MSLTHKLQNVCVRQTKWILMTTKRSRQPIERENTLHLAIKADGNNSCRQKKKNNTNILQEHFWRRFKSIKDLTWTNRKYFVSLFPLSFFPSVFTLSLLSFIIIMGFYNRWCRGKWLCRPVPNDGWQFDGRQVNHIEHQLIYVCIKKWQMTIIVQVPKTEAAVKIDWAKVIFRPQGTWQNSPASCAMSRVMALLREVQVNYIRNSKMPLMWCCDTAEVIFLWGSFGGVGVVVSK